MDRVIEEVKESNERQIDYEKRKLGAQRQRKEEALKEKLNREFD